jgi:bis(5'-nucleosidyl)-tetraphosphatase
MIDERSYGIVPLQKGRQGWNIFMVRHKSGHWALPKGHLEPKETPLECAKRELYEETALSVRALLSEHTFVERYRFLRKQSLIHKQVEYFIAEVEGDIVLQVEEIQDGKWLSLDEAFYTATYPQMKELLKKIQTFLSSF